MVLWPRILSADSSDISREMAAEVQARLRSLVREALPGRPGRSATRIVPWTGAVKLSRSHAPFREPPENYVTIMDFGLCHEISADLAAGEDQVVAALRDAAR